MNKKDILEAIHFGIRSANTEHSQWTGGNWVTAYGVESYIVSCIARSIMDLESPPTYITLETKFSEIYDNNGIRPRGPARKASKDSNKLDLALYCDEAISYAIELKRFWSEDKCLDDIERLCCLMRTLSRDKGGSLRGAFDCQSGWLRRSSQPLFCCAEREKEGEGVPHAYRHTYFA